MGVRITFSSLVFVCMDGCIYVICKYEEYFVTGERLEALGAI